MALPFSNKVWLTRVHTQIEGDTFFPALGLEWERKTAEAHLADEKHIYNFDFECWQRK
jgi:dihydrofolate reductase